MRLLFLFVHTLYVVCYSLLKLQIDAIDFIFKK